MSLFQLPQDRIDRQRVEAFLEERLVEGLTLEYKRETNDQALQTIAAMANTYGGVLLIGVADDGSGRPVLPASGVPLSDREKLVNKCLSKLDPPVTPEITEVPWGDDLYVLVVRMRDMRSVRPVVLDGRVMFRSAGRNVPADRFRLTSIFTEANPSHTTPNLGSGSNVAHGNSLLVEKPGITFRAVLAAERPPGAVRRLGVSVHELLDNALHESAIETFAREESDQLWRHRPQPQSWHRRGFNTATTVTFEREPAETHDDAWDVVGQCMLSIPSFPVGGWLTLALDVGFRRREGDDKLPPFLFVETVYECFHALIASLLDTIAPRVLPKVLGVGTWTQAGPSVHIDTRADPLGDYVRLNRYPQAPGAHDHPGGSFALAAEDDVSTISARDTFVKAWIEELLLNRGYGDFETDLVAFAVPPRDAGQEA